MRKFLTALLFLVVLLPAGCLGPTTGGPRAVIATSPSPAQGAYPLTVAFDGSSSQGDISEYLWAFGDGTTASGPSPSHTYRERGTYTVYLTVIARNGATDQAATTVYVHSQPPVARFTVSPSTAKVNNHLTFDAGTSYDPDGTIAEYGWDFGDGSWLTTTDPVTTHAYRDIGQYLVTLVVKDHEGDTSVPEPRPVVVVSGGCCGN